MKYRYASEEAKKISKYGIDVTVYGEDIPGANVVYVEVEEGHFQEFLDPVATYMYYIIEGEGTFILNDEPTEAKTSDLIVVPPNTRIHYFGKMKMVLTITPAFDETREQHVRLIEKKEDPNYRA